MKASSGSSSSGSSPICATAEVAWRAILRVGLGAGWVIGSPVFARSRRRRGEVQLSKGQSSFRPDLGRLRQEMDCVATLAMTCRKMVSIWRNYRAESEASGIARRLRDENKELACRRMLSSWRNPRAAGSAAKRNCPKDRSGHRTHALHVIARSHRLRGNPRTEPTARRDRRNRQRRRSKDCVATLAMTYRKMVYSRIYR